jgi:hypothetical protein
MQSEDDALVDHPGQPILDALMPFIGKTRWIESGFA